MTSFIQVLIRLVLAVIAGGIVGLEREAVHKPAGIRTHMLVCVSSALAVLITIEQLPTEAAWIIAGIEMGIGFLGAGTIFKSKNEVHGLTTASSILAISILGLTIGMGYYMMAGVAFILILFILHLKYISFLKHHA